MQKTLQQSLKLPVFIGLCLLSALSLAAELEIAIVGGRVVDPETGLDAVRNIGIREGRIIQVTTDNLTADTVIDASGKVVSPGFIDMHAHGQTISAGRMQALDGVTTALDLEGGTLPVADYYQRLAAEGRPINYGVSVNWGHARIATFLKKKPVARHGWFYENFDNTLWQEAIATDAQLQQISAMVKEGLDQGGLGVGMLLGYAPGTGREEYYRMAALAAERDVPIFTHARFLSMIEPNSSFEGIEEIIAAAAGTGVRAHIVHLNSISLREIEAIGGLISGAQQRGLRVTTEAYPYGAGSTGIGAAMFRGPKWRERIGGVTAANFDVGGERLTAKKLAYLQREKPETGTIIHFLETSNPADQKLLDQSVLFPGGVIASDGIEWKVDGKKIDQTIWPLPENAWSHPRSAGTYARFLSHYVREQQAVSLLQAITRVSYGPAKILQDAVPQMRRKGRIQEGADADIVIFDLATVKDRATFEKPAQASEGFDYVVVNGVVLVAQGKLKTDVMPGRAIRNPVQ